MLHAGSSGTLPHHGGLSSPSSAKIEPVTSPVVSSGPSSTPNSPRFQSVKTGLGSTDDVAAVLDVPEVPPLTEALPGLPNTHTPSAGKRYLFGC